MSNLVWFGPIVFQPLHMKVFLELMFPLSIRYEVPLFSYDSVSWKWTSDKNLNLFQSRWQFLKLANLCSVVVEHLPRAFDPHKFSLPELTHENWKHGSITDYPWLIIKCAQSITIINPTHKFINSPPCGLHQADVASIVDENVRRPKSNVYCIGEWPIYYLGHSPKLTKTYKRTIKGWVGAGKFDLDVYNCTSHCKKWKTVTESYSPDFRLLNFNHERYFLPRLLVFWSRTVLSEYCTLSSI